MVTLIDAALRCEQYFKYECSDSHSEDWLWKKRGGKEVTSHLPGGSEVKGGCSCYVTDSCYDGEICNCAANDATWRYDDGTLTQKSDLPIHSMQYGDTGGAGEQGYSHIGPLKCFFSKSSYPASCSYVRPPRKGVLRKEVIDPDGASGTDPFMVECDFSTDPPGNIVHHDKEGREHVNGYESKGSFVATPNYNLSLASMVTLINAALRCEQYFKYECSGSHSEDWLWKKRGGVEVTSHLPGGSETKGGCSCHVTDSCDGGGICSCAENDDTWRYDDGTLTEKSALPIHSMMYGDTGSDFEQGYSHIGPLKCFFSKFKFTDCPVMTTVEDPISSSAITSGNNIDQTTSQGSRLNSNSMATMDQTTSDGPRLDSNSRATNDQTTSQGQRLDPNSNATMDQTSSVGPRLDSNSRATIDQTTSQGQRIDPNSNATMDQNTSVGPRLDSNSNTTMDQTPSDGPRLDPNSKDNMDQTTSEGPHVGSNSKDNLVYITSEGPRPDSNFSDKMDQTTFHAPRFNRSVLAFLNTTYQNTKAGAPDTGRFNFLTILCVSLGVIAFTGSCYSE